MDEWMIHGSHLELIHSHCKELPTNSLSSPTGLIKGILSPHFPSSGCSVLWGLELATSMRMFHVGSDRQGG